MNSIICTFDTYQPIVQSESGYTQPLCMMIGLLTTDLFPYTDSLDRWFDEPLSPSCSTTTIQWYKAGTDIHAYNLYGHDVTTPISLTIQRWRAIFHFWKTVPLQKIQKIIMTHDRTHWHIHVQLANASSLEITV